MRPDEEFQDRADRPLEEAIRWRLRLAESSAKTSPDFELWLADPVNQAAWNQLAGPGTIWTRSHRLRKCSRRGRRPWTMRGPCAPGRQRGRLMAIAASLLIGLTAAGGHLVADPAG